MYRPNRSPRLTPVWVQEQYAAEEATVWSQQVIGLTTWKLIPKMFELAGSPAAPEELLNDSVYLSLIR